LPACAGPREPPAQRIDAGVQVVLDGIEVAVISVGDLGRDGALGDLIDVGRGHVEGGDDGIENTVDPAHDFGVGAVELLRFAALAQLALASGRSHAGNLGRDRQ
jgi:hypothetical protein